MCDQTALPVTSAIRNIAVVRADTDGTATVKAGRLLELCDQIDVLHRNLEEENERLRKKMHNQSNQLAEVQDALRRRNEDLPKREYVREMERLRAEVERMRADWVPLPLDADGVPIHIGDAVENNEKVGCIMLSDKDDHRVFAYKLPHVLHEYFCSDVGHYHGPTVECLLQKVVAEVEAGATAEGIVAEYAPKLRLAEGES